MSRVEVFLDGTPGETRGVILRDGRAEHLIIQRDDDALAHRLGARSVGRVARIEPGLKAAFVDLGEAGSPGFLPLSGPERLDEGAKIEVEVTAEPRDGKGPGLRRIGPADGEIRLLTNGPDVAEQLESLAPGVTPITGVMAIRAAWKAEEEALGPGVVVESAGLDLRLERTRAMVTADFDWTPSGAGRGRSARDRANARGLVEVARLMRLKNWGGLAAVDLIGVGHDGETILASARQAFAAETQVVFGPVNRFGVLMLSLPWGRRPIEETLSASARSRAQAAVRALRHALLSDPASATMTIRLAPEPAALAEPWIRALGPRARLTVDPVLSPIEFQLEGL